MTRKKVFHIVDQLNLGGAVTVAVNIARSKNREFEYHLVEVARGNGRFTNDMLMCLEKESISIHRSFIPIKN